MGLHTSCKKERRTETALSHPGSQMASLEIEACSFELGGGPWV